MYINKLLKIITMEKITKIYTDESGNPIITHYNGSWNVIKHESTDNLDYSISIWESIYQGVSDAEEYLERELTDEEYNEEVSIILEYMSDAYDIELIIEIC